jgi:hypothetical protein
MLTLTMRALWTVTIMALMWGVPLPSSAGAISEIKAVPAKIILGALEYGQNNNSTAHFRLRVEGIPGGCGLTHIDCSQAAGISIVGEQKEGPAVVVELEVDKRELSSGQPYGAFIKKQIRLETDCPGQPQFVVPVIAWVDINHSSRNFSQFVFQGKPRWQGPWSTPNVAGAMLATSVLSLIGLAGWLPKRISQKNNVVLLLSFSLALTATGIVLWLLCKTYSREAWLAFFLASGVMALCSIQLRGPALWSIAVFIVFLCCTPSGVQRFESYAHLDADLSIANRFKLWGGALQMMADHPLTGVGAGGFSLNFERDYQQFSHTAQTSTAVSDYLTTGAEHGILVLGLLVGPLLLLLVWSLRLCRMSGSLPLIVFTAMLLGLMTTSCFSTLWIVPDYRWMAGITLGGLLWYAVIKEFWKREFKSFTFQLLLQSSKWTLATSLVLFAMGVVSLGILPTRFSTHEIAGSDSHLMRYDEIEPRWASPKGTILYLADLSNEAALSHSTLRPMATMGWRVIPVSCGANPEWVHDLINAIRQAPSSGNIFVAGETSGAKLAWKIAAEEPPQIVKAGGGFDFLSSDMDAPEGKGAPSQPFLVYQSLYDDGASSNPAILACNRIAFKGLPLTVVLSDGSTSHFSSGWVKFLTTLNIFFDHECRRH